MRRLFTVPILKSRSVNDCEHLKFKLASSRTMNSYALVFYINGYKYLTSYISGFPCKDESMAHSFALYV